MLFVGKVKNPLTKRFSRVIAAEDCGFVKAVCAKRAKEMYGNEIQNDSIFTWVRNSGNIPFFDEKCEYGDIICVEPVDIVK